MAQCRAVEPIIGEYKLVKKWPVQVRLKVWGETIRFAEDGSATYALLNQLGREKGGGKVVGLEQWEQGQVCVRGDGCFDTTTVLFAAPWRGAALFSELRRPTEFLNELLVQVQLERSLAWCSAVQQIEAENLEVVGEVAGSSPAGADGKILRCLGVSSFWVWIEKSGMWTAGWRWGAGWGQNLDYCALIDLREWNFGWTRLPQICGSEFGVGICGSEVGVGICGSEFGVGVCGSGFEGYLYY
ncbi:hypothetical protein B0H19DRAFT_1086323 [Mycena capillaripes]|nr:hypothetical protein B0H19DRAFT_1086323 [Mycena capillaripes]